LTPGFLGTEASLLADITLVIYVLIIVPTLLIGFVFARRRLFVPHHKMVMTLVTLVNWVFILWVMAVTYSQTVAPGLPGNLTDVQAWLPTVHLVTGALSQLLATYLVGRMWLEKVLPRWLMVQNIKRYMRFTLATWLLTALLGLGIYTVYYVPEVQALVVPPSATEAAVPAPVITDEPVSTEQVQPAATPEVGS
jgi:uncharacterized membrane protein YozB (DUF420 family)